MGNIMFPFLSVNRSASRDEWKIFYEREKLIAVIDLYDCLEAIRFHLKIELKTKDARKYSFRLILLNCTRCLETLLSHEFQQPR